jgi:hypothetical protein
MLDDVATFLNVSVRLNLPAAAWDSSDRERYQAWDSHDLERCQASAFRYVTHGNIAYEVTLGDEFQALAPRTERQRLVIVFRP